MLHRSAPHSVAHESRGVGAVKGAHSWARAWARGARPRSGTPLTDAAEKPRQVFGYRMMELSICTQYNTAVRYSHRET